MAYSRRTPWNTATEPLETQPKKEKTVAEAVPEYGAAKKVVNNISNTIKNDVAPKVEYFGQQLGSSLASTGAGAVKGVQDVASTFKPPVSPMVSKLSQNRDTLDTGIQKAELIRKQIGEPVNRIIPRTTAPLADQKAMFAQIPVEGQERPVTQLTDWSSGDQFTNQFVNGMNGARDWLSNTSDELAQRAAETGKDFSPLTRGALDLGVSVTTNLMRDAAAVGVASLTGGVGAGIVSDLLMGLPAYGNALRDAQQRGLSGNDARLYALRNAGIEVGSEHMFDLGDVNGYNFGLNDIVENAIDNSFMSGINKYLTKTAAGILTEGGEEFIASLADDANNLYTFGDKKSAGQSLEDATKAFVQGALSAMILGGLRGDYTSKAYDRYKGELAMKYLQLSDIERQTAVARVADLYGIRPDLLERSIEDHAIENLQGMDAETLQRVAQDDAPIAILPDTNASVYEYKERLNDDQTKALEIADRLGAKAYIVEDLGEGVNGVTLDDGTILISSEASAPATRTMFHELTHAMRNEGTWQDFRDFAVEQMQSVMGDDYAPFIERLSNSYSRYYAQDETFQDKLDEEIAANYVEKHLFQNEDAVRRLYNRNGNIFQRMWQGLKDIVANFKGNLSPEEKNLVRAEKMFANIVRETREEAYDNVGVADGTAYPAMYSRNTWEALGDDGKRQLAQDIANRVGVKVEVAQKWLNDINSVSAMIAADQNRLDYEPNNAYTALKNDQDYIYTVDMSTLCKKRILLSNTIDEIQKMLPNVTLTGDDYIRIRQMMKDKGYEVACGFCYVESRRKFLDTVAQQFIDAVSGNPKVTNKNQLAISSELKNKDTYIPTLYDLTTADGSNALMNEHPDVYSAFVDFNNARGQNRVKLIETRTEYNGEIMKITEGRIRKLIRQGGLRLQSYSDFETPHLIDMMQVVADMSRRGLTSQAYTKVPNFADAFGETGIKINESLVVTGVDENGELIYDDVEGMPHEIAFALRQKHPENVGTIVVGKDDETILAAMADPKIDFIIPFHKSGWKNEEYANLGIAGYKDYTNYQNERDVVSGKADVGNFYPMDYWDFSVSGDENAKTYLRMCEEQGRIPKFDNFLTKDKEGHWVAPSGYWKTLIDFKMYDNNGVGVPQRVVTPTFDDAVNQRILDEYEGDHNKYSPKMDIVNEFIREKGYGNTRYSLSDDELDRQYFDALNRGDTEEAQRLLEERANERGYTDRAYHGTPSFGFTKPDPSVYSDDGMSFFVTPSEDVAMSYSGYEGTRAINELPSATIQRIREQRRNEAKEAASKLSSQLESISGDENNISAEMIDDAFMDIVNNNDPLRARQLIATQGREWLREAFNKRFPDGNNNDILKPFFLNVADVANAYASIYEPTSEGKGNYDLYVNPDGLLNLDAKGNKWNSLSFTPEELGVSEDNPAFDDPYLSTRDLAEFAEHYGYPGYRLDNVIDYGANEYLLDETNPDTVYALFNPQSQVKSADTITYDDEGNIIPPSQRYNANNPDIRYSLSDEQEEYFKDSKIRDEDGNLIPVYHGTMEDFTVFDRSKGRSTMDIQGMFFSPWEIDASGYGDNVGEYYLNITNPASEAQGYAALRRFQGQNNAGVKAREYLESLGYDGVNNSDEEYIAFYPEQIKRTDNLNPTKNPDIRYSVTPDQANTFAQRNNPQDLSAMRTLGAIDRENGTSTDPLTYESIEPHTWEAPENLRNVNDIMMENDQRTEPERLRNYQEMVEDTDPNKYQFDEPESTTDPDEDELAFYQSLNANKTGALQGFGTIGQTFDAIAGKNTDERKTLENIYERPMFDTKKEYMSNRTKAWDTLDKLIADTGIKAGTEESAAVQWYGEGEKQNEDGTKSPYTLDDLKREFPSKWQDIVKMEEAMRKMYDEYVVRINAALEQVYPNLEEKAQAQLESWRNKRNTLRGEIAQSTNQTAINYWTQEIDKLDQKIANLERGLETGEYFRNKRLFPRKDYFHHFNEVTTQGIGGLKNLLAAPTLIDPELVGKSEFTKPRAKWMDYLQKRSENGKYTADAVLGLAKYIDGAEYAIAFDPLIAQYRDEISKMVKATKQTKNANQLIQYLSGYTNNLAGKTASIDRTILDLFGEGNRGQLFNVLSAINNRAKSNAVVGNLRSAVSQFFNIPNAMSLIKSNSAWAKAVTDYAQAKTGNRELLDQSPFLAERYWSHNADDLKERKTTWDKITGKVGDFSNKLMEFGDREATELIWFAAYNEATEKGLTGDDAIFYADKQTRNAVAGRGIGEVPYNMKSKLASFFMPFQVESNNQWQNVKQMVRDKDVSGIMRLMVGTYLMNALVKPLFNDGVLPDILDALISGIGKLFDPEREETVGETLLNTGKRVAGEGISMIPGTSLWLPLMMSSDTSEALFGDSDPTRYGTGTVGLSNIANVVADAVDGDDQFDVVSPLLQLGLPYGGKQASRLYNTLQDFNVLPSNGVWNTPFGGETNPVAGDYSRSGALKYMLPESAETPGDAAEIARALLFGSNATNAAREYYDTGKPALSKERVQKLREHPEVDPQTYIDFLANASTDGNTSISQEEAYNWLVSQDLTNEERNALWDIASSSWKRSYDEYVPKEEETQSDTSSSSNNSNNNNKGTTKEEFVSAADTNGNGRVTQKEAYAYLSNSGLSQEEIDNLWALQGWKTSYDEYEKRNS